MVLTFSMGMKKWFGFGGVWWTAPLAGDVPRIRSPACPLLRWFGRRRAFLSRNSTSSRSTALFSGKLIFKLLPPMVWCKLAAMAGGVSMRKNTQTHFQWKLSKFFYSISFCGFKFLPRFSFSIFSLNFWDKTACYRTFYWTMTPYHLKFLVQNSQLAQQ